MSLLGKEKEALIKHADNNELVTTQPLVGEAESTLTLSQKRRSIIVKERTKRRLRMPSRLLGEYADILLG